MGVGFQSCLRSRQRQEVTHPSGVATVPQMWRPKCGSGGGWLRGSRSHGLSSRRAKGSRHGAMKYTFEKGKVPVLGTDVVLRSSGSARPQQQSEVTYGWESDVNPKQTLGLKRASLIPHQDSTPGLDRCGNILGYKHWQAGSMTRVRVAGWGKGSVRWAGECGASRATSVLCCWTKWRAAAVLSDRQRERIHVLKMSADVWWKPGIIRPKDLVLTSRVYGG